MNEQTNNQSFGASVRSFEEALSKYGCVIFTGKGTSMLPLIRDDRDVAVINSRPKGNDGRPLRCKRYEAVLYRQNNWYILHRILRVLPTEYIICGDNCWHREYVRDEEIIGVMTAFVRGGKEISVANKGYRLYVHLWCDLYPIRAAILCGRHILYKAVRLFKKHRRSEQ